MSANNWLPMLGEAAAVAAVAAAALLARRAHLLRMSHRQRNARIKSWENEGGRLAAATE